MQFAQIVHLRSILLNLICKMRDMTNFYDTPLEGETRGLLSRLLGYASIELIALGLLAALVLVLAVPLFSEILIFDESSIQKISSASQKLSAK